MFSTVQATQSLRPVFNSAAVHETVTPHDNEAAQRAPVNLIHEPGCALD